MSIENPIKNLNNPPQEIKIETEKDKHFEASDDLKKESKDTKGNNLYDISKTRDGNYEVILPGVFDKKNEVIFGTSRKHFQTLEEAKQTVEDIKESIRIQKEIASLEKSYTHFFYKIDETNERKFKVTVPGLKDSETGYFVGTTSREFKIWDEAKEFFLQSLESQEKLKEKPILELELKDDARLSFSDLQTFNPKVAPSELEYKLPDSIYKYIQQKESRAMDINGGGQTYQRTLEEKAWERKTYSFVSNYLEKENPNLAKDLKIEQLDNLTPRQAVELTTNIVLELSKYKRSDIGKKNTEADNNSALKFLQEGLRNKDDQSWEGNGVCRNIASAVKAVFESLKANQTKFNKLKNTYCLFEDGFEHKPKRGKQWEQGEHAWNTFLTATKEGEANAVIIDATWGNKNYETKKTEGLDYTLTRMEPIAYETAMDLDEDSPNKEEQIEHLLSYYKLKAEMPGGAGGYVSENEETAFYLARALQIINKHNFSGKTDKEFISLLIKSYGNKEITSIADKSEIESIWNIYKENGDLPMRGILKNYLEEKKIDNYHADSLIVADNNLQKEIFEQIKLHNNFEKIIKESPKFRIRMREAIPELFAGFFPASKKEDTMELKYLIEDSNYLRSYTRFVDINNPSEESLNSLFTKVKEKLESINPRLYHEKVENIDSYQIIKNYDRFYEELKLG